LSETFSSRIEIDEGVIVADHVVRGARVQVPCQVLVVASTWGLDPGMFIFS
jgi:hypothetical protein